MTAREERVKERIVWGYFGVLVAMHAFSFVCILGQRDEKQCENKSAKRGREWVNTLCEWCCIISCWLIFYCNHEYARKSDTGWEARCKICFIDAKLGYATNALMLDTRIGNVLQGQHNLRH